ncbi:putative transport protein YidE [Escherichia coli]|uniref:Putative transport protein YidE n=1 Tax=Escherichia coli TaxID=562 RepID=A0A377AIB4_ECOLX|nr:putative transport protein YidE [Escherichia coli]
MRDLGTPMEMVDQMGMSYAMAYPFGICGILFTMWMLRVIFRVNVETEAQQHESSRTNGGALIKTINIRVENPNLHDLAIKDVPILNGDKIICSRLKREETLKFLRQIPLSNWAICCIWWVSQRIYIMRNW